MGNKINIEVDLDEILYEQGEYGEALPAETMKQSIQRQLREGIIREIETKYLSSFKDKLFSELLSSIKTQCLEEAHKKIPELLENALTRQYEIVDRWGSKSSYTSFMEEFVKSLTAQMKYESKSWDSDKNTFTKVVDSTVDEMVKQWKDDFNKHIRENVLKDCYSEALVKIAKAFNVTVQELEK